MVNDVWYISHAEYFMSIEKGRGCMKDTRMPLAYAAILVAYS